MDTHTSPANRVSTEHILYFLAFALGLALRLLNLGAGPLTNYEAGWAVQALSLAHGNPVTLGPQPAYLIITSLLFAIFKDTNGMARLFPAVAGSLLVLLPLFFSGIRISSAWLRRVGILLAFGLALDPGLVALSRIAGGPMAAIALSLLTAGAIYSRKPRLAGALGGLALLSGPSLLQGILGFLLAWLAWKVLAQAGLVQPLDFLKSFSTPEERRAFWKQALIFGAVTLVAVSTLLLRVPQGFAAFMKSLPAYLSDWTGVSGIPALRLPAALLFYQPLALLAGLAGGFLGWYRSSSQELPYRLARFMSLWSLLGIFAGLILPGRQVSDIAWALVPLWGMAAIALSAGLMEGEKQARVYIALGHAAVNVLFFTLTWHNLLRIEAIGADPVMSIAISSGIVLMLVIVAILVSAGWSWKTSLAGITWGISAFLVLIMFFALWRSTQTRPNAAAELWSIGPETGQVDLLVKTMTDLSSWKTGQRYELDAVVTVDSAVLRWELRHFDNTRFMAAIPPEEQPSVILTPPMDTLPGLTAGYRGQDLVLSEYPGWTGVLPDNLLDWMTFREAPTSPEKFILWARNDLFPGGSLLPGPATQPGSPASSGLSSQP